MLLLTLRSGNWLLLPLPGTPDPRLLVNVSLIDPLVLAVALRKHRLKSNWGSFFFRSWTELLSSERATDFSPISFQLLLSLKSWLLCPSPSPHSSHSMLCCWWESVSTALARCKRLFRLLERRSPFTERHLPLYVSRQFLKIASLLLISDSRSRLLQEFLENFVGILEFLKDSWRILTGEIKLLSNYFTILQEFQCRLLIMIGKVEKYQIKCPLLYFLPLEFCRRSRQQQNSSRIPTGISLTKGALVCVAMAASTKLTK